MISNFIDLNLYSQKVDKSLRLKIAKKKEKILVHISNFRKVKRVKDVVKIFNEVQKSTPVKLLMIGDGPERKKAEQLTRKLNISSKVKFMGKLKSVEEFLSIADVFLLPSETESFGLVALEAMASEVAVVSTNSGGLKEVNIDNVTGYLSDVGDISKMSSDVLKILKEDSTLDEFKKRAFNHATNFDLPYILPKYEELYQDLLK